MEKRKIKAEKLAPQRPSDAACLEQEQGEADGGGGGGGLGDVFADGRRQTSKRGAGNNGGCGITTPSSKGGCCQVENCGADMRNAKPYHRRHRVCESHAKAQVVLVSGIRQRFCQQCSRFHDVAEFDESKRSCRKRLAGHNERRRKNPAEPTSAGDASSSRGVACGQINNMQENAAYNKHFHVR